MTLERRYESSGGLVTEKQPFLSLEAAQALLDKINGFPCIQEVLPENGRNYRRSVYFPRENGQLILYTERNGVWIDMSIHSKAPEHQVHLLFPLRAREGKVVTRTHKTQILEWYHLLALCEGISIDELKTQLVKECLSGTPSLQDALMDYPRIAKRAVEPEFGIGLMQVHLLTAQNAPYILK